MKHHTSQDIIQFVLLLFACAFSIEVSADGGRYRFPYLNYHRKPCAEWQGDSLALNLTCWMSGRIKGSESIHLIPIYISGRDSIQYPELSYYTPSGARFNKRSSTFTDRQIPNRICVLRRGSSSDVDYRERRLVPYSTKGKFHLLHVIRDCCGSYIVACDTVSVPQRTGYTAPAVTLPLPTAAVSIPLFETNVSFIAPEAEEVKERTTSATIRITYPQSGWKVLPDYKENRSELRQLDRLLSPIADNPRVYQIQSASIVGYASPEDAYYHNLELSKKRANAMRDYIQSRYRLLRGKLISEGMGEDWEGLRKAVVESDMRYKEDVLDIIDYVNVFDGREQELIRLHAGIPYRYMLRNFFPALRRIEMEIDYHVRAFRSDEAKDMIDSRPQDLSLREMYDVAQAANSDQTIIRRRSEYGREYDIAVRYFSDDDVANINAASAALIRGDLQQAWLCLNKVTNNPLAYNNIGIYCWICGKIDEAETYFIKAKQVEPDRAAYNLEQLYRWKKDFSGKR